MIKIMEKVNKLSLSVTILIASIILGGFYYASEVNKQKSIERQQQIELQVELQRKIDLSDCLASADASNFAFTKKEECFKQYK